MEGVMNIARFSVFCLLLMGVGSVVQAEEIDSLAQRVQQQEIRAIEEAGQKGRKDLIPVLERIACLPLDPAEPTRISARNALAKLGEEKYLKEIVEELVYPTSAATYGTHRQYCVRMYGASPEIKLLASTGNVQYEALGKLAYVNDKRTVQYIVAFLNDKRKYFKFDPEPWQNGLDITMSDTAIDTLASMNLKDAPVLVGINRYPRARKVAWQKWWEGHHDYYQKLKPILPPGAYKVIREMWKTPSSPTVFFPVGGWTSIPSPLPVSPTPVILTNAVPMSSPCVVVPPMAPSR